MQAHARCKAWSPGVKIDLRSYRRSQRPVRNAQYHYKSLGFGFEYRPRHLTGYPMCRLRAACVSLACWGHVLCEAVGKAVCAFSTDPFALRPIPTKQHLDPEICMQEPLVPSMFPFVCIVCPWSWHVRQRFDFACTWLASLRWCMPDANSLLQVFIFAHELARARRNE